ncbi:ATP-binding protein [Jeotgalibaca sp. A122]|uniref:ATP-binding protein n=1 Tax=Jeotgalibaca sp. A122 TaxID=3457322 RepID=UPI003FD2293B
MKRKNLILRSAFILMVVTLVIVNVFNQLERQNYQSTIKLDYMDSVRYSLTQVEKNLNVAPDVSVILVEANQSQELNQELTSTDLSKLIQTDFLRSSDGLEFMRNPQVEPLYFSYQNEKNVPYSFFAIAKKTDAGTLLVSKDASIFEVYVHNKEMLDFGLVFSLFTIVFVLLFFLDKRIFTRILEMTELAYEYSENKFSNSIEIKSNDQIDNLAIAINKIGKTLEASNLINTQERKLLEHVYDFMETGVIYVEEDFTIHELNTLGQRFFTSFIKNDEGRYGIEQFYEDLIMETCHSKEMKQVEIQQNQMIFDIRFILVELNESADTHGILLLVKDITTDKQLMSIREDLITNVSHDLRTPLATIQGYSEAIKDDIAETLEEKNEMAKIIHEEATQMSNMISSLLALSRIKAGYSKLSKELVYLPEFFQKVLNRFYESLQREEITCDLVIEEGIGYYQMDEDKMHHAIYNLIDNAIRYSAEKGTRRKRYIHIEVRLDELVDDLLFIISDNGIGISQESIPFIFERFYKDDKARTSPKNNGSGIGLSLVQTVVKEHGGKIEVESKLNQGTSFMIRLPLLEDV